MNKKEEILFFLQNQIQTNAERLKNYTEDSSGKEYPRRHAFIKLQKYVSEFMKGNKDQRWVIIPGLRGVGKTTLLSQIYFNCLETYKELTPQNVLYISVDDIKTKLDVTLDEVLTVYFEILRTRIEELKHPVILFLDEVQYDSEWAKVLKIAWDKTKNLFIFCSGSSAISLQTNPDAARRSVVEKVYPVSFGEFLMIKYGILPEKSLKKELKSAIYSSANAEDVFKKLKQIESKTSLAWTKAPRYAQIEYLETGSLPFAINAPNKEKIYDVIDQLLDKIISKDIQSLGKFDSDTLGIIKRMLLIVAEADTISYSTLEKLLPIKRITIMNVFDVLEKAELIIKIPAYGSSTTVAKKPAKYLFMSPAIRQALMSITGLPATQRTREGKLIEDIVGMHLYREFLTPAIGVLTYDNAQAGADFILQIANQRQIAIEIGRGKKGCKQVLNTMQKVKCDYGLSFGKNELTLHKDDNIVQIPSYYFLLM